MTSLHDLYPGDRALDFGLIVALGVTLLSGAAWIVASRLPRQPAARHLILVSALFCCLGMPVLAWIFSASGMTLFTIPLLPAELARLESVDALVAPNPAAPRQRAGANPDALIGREDVGSARFRARQLDLQHQGPARAADADPRVRTTTGGRAAAPRVGPEQGGNLASWPAAYRGSVTVVLVLWACGTMLLLAGFARSCVLIGQLRRRSSPLCDDALRLLLDDVGRRSGVARLPEVVVSRRVIMPFAVGVRRPAVVLPKH